MTLTMESKKMMNEKLSHRHFTMGMLTKLERYGFTKCLVSYEKKRRIINQLHSEIFFNY